MNLFVVQQAAQINRAPVRVNNFFIDKTEQCSLVFDPEDELGLRLANKMVIESSAAMEAESPPRNVQDEDGLTVAQQQHLRCLAPTKSKKVSKRIAF